MRISRQAFVVHGQFLLAVDRQQQVIAAQAEVFDTGGGEFLFGVRMTRTYSRCVRRPSR